MFYDQKQFWERIKELNLEPICDYQICLSKEEVTILLALITIAIVRANNMTLPDGAVESLINFRSRIENQVTD